MGNRISISFVNGSTGNFEESVALFSHWDGRDFLKTVRGYFKELQETYLTGEGFYPLDRLEPNTVMMDLIVWLAEKDFFGGHVRSNYYLGKDDGDGDNSDNGHWRFNLHAGDWEY